MVLIKENITKLMMSKSDKLKLVLLTHNPKVMSFDDILTLLIGSVESKGKAGHLVEACKKIKMKTHEYFNIFGDPQYCTGYNFIFDTPKGEKARLEIVEVDGGDLVGSGFQVIYKDNNTLDIEFASLYRSLKNYYTNERERFT